MRPILRLAAIGGAVLALSACSDRVVRSIVIDNGHPDPHRITVPAGRPFTLKAAAIGPRATTLSAPELGVAALEVPNTWAPAAGAGRSVGAIDLREVRAEVGPPAAGAYDIRCECGDAPRIIRLIAE